MGADPVDEAAIIAWVDGELTGAEAARVEAAVANDADWRALADRHRRMKARFAAAFDPLARPPAEVISLADVRARRAAKAAPAPSHGWRRWAAGGAIAASLVVGLFVLQDRGGAPGGGVPAPVAVALNDQLSGDAGPVRVALSFRDRNGQYCRSFTGGNAVRDRLPRGHGLADALHRAWIGARHRLSHGGERRRPGDGDHGHDRR